MASGPIRSASLAPSHTPIVCSDETYGDGHAMSSQFDPYRILQVPTDADQEEIKVAFRRLARRYHPDRAPDAASTARMIEVNRAWEMIGEPGRRATYDRAMGIALRPRPISGARANESAVDPAAYNGGGSGIGNGHASGGSTAYTSASGGSASQGAGRIGGAVPGGSTASRGATPGMGVEGDAGHAGPPPGRPSGSIVEFGRYAGWSLGEIARVDPEYLEWLARVPIGWQFKGQIGSLLAARRAPVAMAANTTPRRKGLFGR